mmetsp:Transcript_2661/g.6711  ORF Transcript_2661/g.6711 Transcript_2661/m.6711 type:complete len:221 (-) Transcript_2661:5-667(-)
MVRKKVTPLSDILTSCRALSSILPFSSSCLRRLRQPASRSSPRRISSISCLETPFAWTRSSSCTMGTVRAIRCLMLETMCSSTVEPSLRSDSAICALELSSGSRSLPLLDGSRLTSDPESRSEDRWEEYNLLRSVRSSRPLLCHDLRSLTSSLLSVSTFGSVRFTESVLITLWATAPASLSSTMMGLPARGNTPPTPEKAGRKRRYRRTTQCNGRSSTRA